MTETQDHQETPCSSFEQMLGYVEQTLSPAKRVEVEKRLTACEFCSEALEGFAAFPEKAKLRTMVESLNEQIQAHYAVKAELVEAEPVEAEPEAALSLADRWQSVVASIRRGLETVVDALATPRYNLRLAYVVASVFLVGIVSVLYLRRDQSHEKLLAEYYQPYPNIAASVRGELTEEKLQDAMQQYDAGDFKAAFVRLQEILAVEPNNTAAQFYAGICQLQLKDAEPALRNFQNVIAARDQKLAEPAAWYAALAYVQRNDLENARALLKGIVAADGVYKEPATKLLERLPR
jgi:tetratricopeptide (TPR) repeat protein